MLSLSHLYELNQYIQDALQREKILENKLAVLQRLLETTSQASNIGWKTIEVEDQLLSRIEILETQLQTYSKYFVEDKMRNKIRKLLEERNEYQIIAKESVKKFLQEKVGVLKRLNDLQRSLKSKNEECAHLIKLREQNLQDVNELAQKYNEQVQIAADLSHKIHKSEELRHETCERLEKEKQDLAKCLDEHVIVIQALQDRVDALTEGNIRRHSEYHYSIQTLLDNQSEIDVGKRINTDPQVDIVSQKIVPKQNNNMNDGIELGRFQLRKSEAEIKEGHKQIDELNTHVKELREQEVYNTELAQQLEETHQISDLMEVEKTIPVLQLEDEINKLISTSFDMKQQIFETTKKLEEETSKADHYASVAETLRKAESDVQQFIKKDSHNETENLKEISELEQKSDVNTSEDTVQLQQKCFALQKEIAHLRREERRLIQCSSKLEDNDVILQDTYQSSSDSLNSDTVSKNIENLKEKCKETEKVNTALKEELDVLNNRCNISNDEKGEIAQELSTYKEKYDHLSRKYCMCVYCIKVVIVIIIILVLVILFFWGFE